LTQRLPPGWAKVRALDVCDAIPNGSTPKSDEMSDAGEVPFVKVYNLTFDGTLDFAKNPTFISRETHETVLRRSRSHPGDVLMNIVGPPLGKVSILPDTFPEWNFNQAIVAFHVRAEQLDNRFLASYLVHESARWASRFSKATVGQHNIAVSDCREIEVPLPPLNEQRRIVAKLESLQARSRRAREALDAVPPLLEKLRQSILAAAFRGDLTKDWRAKHRDVEPASELLKRIRVERRKKWEEAELAKMKAKGKAPRDDGWKGKYKEPEPVDATGLPELPEGWCVVELGEVVWRLTNGYVGPTRDIYVEHGVPYLLSKHVKKNVLRFDGATFITKEFNQRNRKSILQAGDVLLVQTGHVGESAVVPPEHEGHNCHAMIVISPVEEVLDGKYLSLFFGSPATQRAFSAIEKGMTLRHLNCHDVIHLLTVVPPLEEQRAIVARTERRLADLAALGSVTVRQAESLNEFNRALLAKAFRGELVPQDPTDEPAADMLARLRAAEVATPPKPTKSRR